MLAGAMHRWHRLLLGMLICLPLSIIKLPVTYLDVVFYNAPDNLTNVDCSFFI